MNLVFNNKYRIKSKKFKFLRPTEEKVTKQTAKQWWNFAFQCVMRSNRARNGSLREFVIQRLSSANTSRNSKWCIQSSSRRTKNQSGVTTISFCSDKFCCQSTKRLSRSGSKMFWVLKAKQKARKVVTKHSLNGCSRRLKKKIPTCCWKKN